ncbi:MAG: UvrD-helicase domain-containing protein, partial [Planctomycetota bacterium]
PKLHAQQQAAVGHRRSSVGLSAGAGCGKTTVLIERFLQELDPARLDEPGPHGLPAVVAITFTEKATAEMLARVRDGVRRRLRDPERAGERPHWRTIQLRLDTARISTIHSFCAQLLRENAAAADLDPAFRTIEQAERDELRTAAVDDALKAALASPPDRHDGEDALLPRDLVTRCGLRTVRKTLLNLIDADEELLERPWTAEELIAARAAGWWRDLVQPAFEELKASPHWAALRPLLQRNLDTSPPHAAARRDVLDGFDMLFTGPPLDPETLRTRLPELREQTLLKHVGKKGCWAEEDDEPIRKGLEAFRGQVQKFVDKKLGNEPPDHGAAVPILRAYAS